MILDDTGEKNLELDADYRRRYTYPAHFHHPDDAPRSSSACSCAAADDAYEERNRALVFRYQHQTQNVQNAIAELKAALGENDFKLLDWQVRGAYGSPPTR